MRTVKLFMIVATAITLAACTDARPAIITPPAELLTCADEPTAPALAPVDWASVETARPTQLQRDRDTLAYILAWREAWGSCHATVAGVKAWAEAVK